MMKNILLVIVLIVFAFVSVFLAQHDGTNSPITKVNNREPGVYTYTGETRGKWCSTTIPTARCWIAPTATLKPRAKLMLPLWKVATACASHATTIWDWATAPFATASKARLNTPRTT